MTGGKGGGGLEGKASDSSGDGGPFTSQTNPDDFIPIYKDAKINVLAPKPGTPLSEFLAEDNRLRKEGKSIYVPAPSR